MPLLSAPPWAAPIRRLPWCRAENRSQLDPASEIRFPLEVDRDLGERGLREELNQTLRLARASLEAFKLFRRQDDNSLFALSRDPLRPLGARAAKELAKPRFRGLKLPARLGQTISTTFASVCFRTRSAHTPASFLAG